MYKLRILHVISSVNPQAGGPVAGLKQLFSEYRSMGIEAEVACCDSPTAEWLNTEGQLVIHALGPVNSNYSYTPNLIPWLKKNTPRFDAVIVDGIWQFHSLAVCIALSKAKVPYFVFTHGMLGPWFKHTYPLKHLKKWLYWPWADYWVLRKAKAVLFTCNEEKLLARQSFWLYNAEESVVGLGTSTPPDKSQESEHLFLEKFPELINKRIILFVGRLHPIKGCELLLESFAQVAKTNNQLHLLMVGPDHENEMSILQDKANSLGISLRITWTGMLDGDMKWAAFHASEVFCLPSHHENFGVVVAEAMACGKPVLISNKVNIWREIETDSAGFIADDTVEGTTLNLQRWLDLSPEAYAIMSSQATKSFTNRFHIKSSARKLITTIQNKIKIT